MLENIRGHSRGSIPPLRMPSPLPHDLCHEWNVSRRLPAENGIETCVISYMKRVASPGSMHDTGCLGLVHWDDPEGWYREGGGFRMGNTCVPVADSC